MVVMEVVIVMMVVIVMVVGVVLGAYVRRLSPVYALLGGCM